jgi:cell division protein FtsB
MTDELASRRAARRRARTKRPRRILGLWARAALSVGLIAVTLFLAVCLAAKAVKPYREASRQRVQLAATRQENEMVEAQNVQLEQRIAYLRTPGGIASEARRMGYLCPGEYPIVVEGLKDRLDPGKSPSGPAPAPSAPQPSPLRRFWRHLSGQ